MRRSPPFLLAAAAVSLAAGLAPGFATAQPAGPAAVAVLYDQPNFHGRSVRVVGAMSDLRRWGFAHRAMSAQFDGDWMICAAPRYAGRCVTVTGTHPDLLTLGFDRQIISLRQGETVAEPPAAAAAPPAPQAPTDDGYFDGPPRADRAEPPPETGPAPASTAPAAAGQGVAGYASVFFARPWEAGADVPGQGRAAADAFCRDQGLGPTLSFDSDGHVLRDVLCRRD